MKILFIGCVISSYELLLTLLSNNCNIVGVITKKTSSFHGDFKDLSEICQVFHIDVFFADTSGEAELHAFISVRMPDVIYCFGWSHLLKKNILELPPKGVVGFHPAALPLNRGRHPLIWAMVLGLKETASTFFFMEEAADTGAILSQNKIEILYEDYAADLYLKILSSAKKQVLEITRKLEKNELHPVLQTPGNSWRKRGPEDGNIDWRMNSYSIYNLIRALSHPYPGACFFHKGDSFAVWKAKESFHPAFPNIEPGKIVKVVSETEFYVKAYDNVIHILECDPICLREGEYLR